MLKTNMIIFVLAFFIAIGKSDDEGACDAYDDDCNDIDEKLTIDWSLNELKQDDPKLIQIIKDKYLIPPSTEEYNFTVPVNELNYGGQYTQPTTIDRQIFDNKLRNGFFVEAGASNGELISNTLHYEIRRGWNGLLVEPNPDLFKDLKAKNRKAWLINSCFSTKDTPEVIKFDAAGVFGGIEYEGKQPGELPFMSNDEYFKDIKRRTIQMQCFPVYSILQALGNPTVHYFSLDIEGAETMVLKTIPFDKVDIKVWDIETNHVGEIFPGTAKFLSTFMKKSGYKYHSSISIDDIYVKRGFKV